MVFGEVGIVTMLLRLLGEWVGRGTRVICINEATEAGLGGREEYVK